MELAQAAARAYQAHTSVINRQCLPLLYLFRLLQTTHIQHCSAITNTDKPSLLVTNNKDAFNLQPIKVQYHDGRLRQPHEQ
jgi:hypothetical protein